MASEEPSCQRPTSSPSALLPRHLQLYRVLPLQKQANGRCHTGFPPLEPLFVTSIVREDRFTAPHPCVLVNGECEGDLSHFYYGFVDEQEWTWTFDALGIFKGKEDAQSIVGGDEYQDTEYIDLELTQGS